MSVSEPNTIFSKPITEIIQSRYSVRTYRNQPLSHEIKQKIKQYILELEAQADFPIRLKMIDNDAALNENGARLGTYGVIKGASSFAAAALPNSTVNIERFGYLFEKLILFAVSMGIGTCWLALTMNRNEFSKALEMSSSEFLPVITPLGYPSKSFRPLDKMPRLLVRSWSRKDWDQLFFNTNFKHPLTESQAGEYATPLEMLRLAPSASNHQPWRVVQDTNSFHFFVQRTRGYRNRYTYDIQRLDIGIAMCHFELTSLELGMKGQWIYQKPDYKELPEDTEYISSWINSGN